MSEVERLVKLWRCEVCGDEWPKKLGRDGLPIKPRFCRSCRSEYWWDGKAPLRPAKRATVKLVKPLKGQRTVIARSPLSVVEQMKEIGRAR